MKLSDLVNQVAPFCFERAGFKLEGDFYINKTATPAYQKELARLSDERNGALSEIDERIAALKPDDPERERLQKKRDIAKEERDRVGYKWLADAVKTWNAQDDSEQLLPVTEETFNQLPIPFLMEFSKYLAGLRDGNFTNGSSSSPSGSQP